MEKRYYLGIDVGTFSSRGILLDEDFHLVADESVPHGMDNPAPGYFEHDALGVWWADFCKLSRVLLQSSGISPRQIACVGASALGTDCLPVDENCEPLRPAILYGIDARASKEAEWLTEYYGAERVRQLFGHPICSGDTATKILWIRRHEPEIYARTYKFLTGSSFLAARLTGRYTIDQFLAKGSFRPLYLADGSVNEAECGLYCRPDQLAEALPVTEIIGGVTEKAAAETGLAPGTPVIVGTGDSTAEAISVGLVEPGTAFFQYGSSMYYYYCIDRAVESHVSPQGNGRLNGSKVFTVPGTHVLGDGTNAAGTLTRWVRDLLYAPELAAEAAGGENAYAVMAREAARVPRGADGLMMLPYIYGERSPLQDPRATGLLFGLRGSHGRAHINRAALEAVGYSTLQHLALFRELGLPPRRIITAGGGTKNRTWMQIVCDICGLPITIPESRQCSAFGDAMLAALGAGRLADFSDLRRALPRGTVLEPDEAAHAFYAARYPLFRDLYLDNRDKMHALAEQL